MGVVGGVCVGEGVTEGGDGGAADGGGWVCEEVLVKSNDVSDGDQYAGLERRGRE